MEEREEWVEEEERMVEEEGKNNTETRAFIRRGNPGSQDQGQDQKMIFTPRYVFVFSLSKAFAYGG